MPYHATLRSERFTFPDLKTLFARANEEKSGDQLAGLAAQSERERVAAKIALAEVPLGEIVANPLIDPDQDEVSRLILDTHDQSAFREIRSLTVGEFRERLLDEESSSGRVGGSATARKDVADALAGPSAKPPDPAAPKDWQQAITPEIAAAAARLMSNKDLIVAASKIRNVTRCRNTLGEAGVLGIRIQPNHPQDDPTGILLSALDGLFYGCGDAVIGVNPATESVETVAAILHSLQMLITRLEIPTQSCCLAHITTQLAALDRGAPVDLLFQSVAGTQAANESFGINLSLLKEGRERVLEHHRQRDVNWVGDNVMYFETGQGSALSAGAHHGVDQLTLEARAYGVACEFAPFLVNTVVGFIGPEYLANERQIIRAGLEDHFLGKLLGLPMGCDVCYTNHADADQNSADNLLVLLASAGCNYFMGVPCADDVMLNYQSTSYHDAVAVRELLGLRPAPEFERWLESRGIFRRGKLASPNGQQERLLDSVRGLLP